MENKDINNNGTERTPVNFDLITKDTVEAELEKLKIIDDDYYSDDDRRDRVRLTGNGIDFKALKAGQDIEFELDPNGGEDNFNWEDEEDKPIDYEKIFMHRNMDMVGMGPNCRIDDEDEDDAAVDEGDKSKSKSSLTPFEILRTKMIDISPDNDNGVVKRVLENGVGIVIPNGSRVRSNLKLFFVFL